MTRMGNLLDDIVFPKLVKARQRFPSPPPVDIPAQVRLELTKPEIASRVKRGARIAVGVGSRGVAHIDIIAREVIRNLKALGGQPFIVPAMGSHGGATAEGQINVLRHLGVTEESAGAPIVSSMDVVPLGRSPSGVDVFVDKNAYNADAIVVINRIKPHTLFRGPVESGMLKMLGIGLGKQKGANSIHRMSYERFDVLIPEVGEYIIQKTGKVIFGVASVENAREEPVRIAAVPTERIKQTEVELLKEARALMGRLLLTDLHVLVVKEIGKNISGDGMDPNVTGRYASHVRVTEPKLQRIAVLGLTDETYGNAIGIGMADVTTKRLADATDHYPMYMNCATACVPAMSRMAMVMDTDRDAIAMALYTSMDVEPGCQRMMFIKNTLKLDEVYVSETAAEAARSTPNMEVVGKPFPMRFDASGALALDF